MGRGVVGPRRSAGRSRRVRATRKRTLKMAALMAALRRRGPWMATSRAPTARRSPPWRQVPFLASDQRDGTGESGVSPIEEWSQNGLAGLTLSMAVFSGYLISVLAFKIKAACGWCFVSASCSLFLAGFTWNRRLPLPTVKVGLSSGAMAVLGAGVIFATTSTQVAIADAQTYLATGGAQMELQAPPAITTHSSDRVMKLVKYLEKSDAKMYVCSFVVHSFRNKYGAFWCSHCYDQKQTLGAEAMRSIPYIECAKDGANSQRKLCQEKDIPGYPTWEIDGKYHPGEQTLDELEELIGLKAKAVTPLTTELP
mmetsp:Transcript_86657/g.245279  ORF Transcript_86657/g.245279 Transcript_86657/m.245279 type:complete len:311 (-) Transcript_86657:92-1024(-)